MSKVMTFCFTGHRPNNINLGGYDWYATKNRRIREKLFDELSIVLRAHKDFSVIFITGGAIGIDQFAFDVVEKLKKELKDMDITSEVAVPFKQQSIKWKSSDVSRYEKQLSLADKITYVDELANYKCNTVPVGVYSPQKMQLRNMYMVDKSNIVIAVWDGSVQGGTYNCVKYASDKGKHISVLNPKDI